MKRFFCLLIALASLCACRTPVPSSPPVEPVDLAGIVYRKEWSKSYESWNAGGSHYYVLEVEGGHLPPERWTAREGVILRPSDTMSFEQLGRFVGQRVECRGIFLDGTPYHPPADSAEQLPSNAVNEEAEPRLRGSGFQVLDMLQVCVPR